MKKNCIISSFFVKSPRSGEIFWGCFLPIRREAAENFYLHSKVKKNTVVSLGYGVVLPADETRVLLPMQLGGPGPDASAGKEEALVFSWSSLAHISFNSNFFPCFFLNSKPSNQTFLMYKCPESLSCKFTSQGNVRKCQTKNLLWGWEQRGIVKYKQTELFEKQEYASSEMTELCLFVHSFKNCGLLHKHATMCSGEI